MRKYLQSLLLIIISMIITTPVFACELTYAGYQELEVRHIYVVGEYIFDASNGVSPSLEDFAIAARSIPEGEDEYIYEIMSSKRGYYSQEEIFTGAFSEDPNDYPGFDVTYNYREHIRTSSESDYDVFTCKSHGILVNYTMLSTEGEKEYKTKATRYVSVSSSEGITSAKYCLTTGSTCNPTIDGEVTGNPGVMQIEYETNIAAQRICVEIKDKDKNTSGVICDETSVLVDKEEVGLQATEKLGEVIQGKSYELGELFDVEYSVSGGQVYYYYYEGGKKYLLNDMSELPNGDVKVEVRGVGGNGLPSSESRVIKVEKGKVKYDASTNGGTTSTQEKEVVYNGYADLNVEATKEGYEFVGWNTDKDAKEGLKKLQVTDNITVYAIYKKELTATYVTKNKVDATVAVSERKEDKCSIYNKETSCEVEIPGISSKVGYIAYGWSKNRESTQAEYVGKEKVEISEDTNIYAITREQIATSGRIIHYVNGEIKAETVKCYKYNGESECVLDLSGIVNDSYEGKEFKGYTKNKENVSVETTYKISAGVTYYGYYEEKTKITFKGETGEETKEAIVDYVVTEDGIEDVIKGVEAPEIEAKEGYTILGWKKGTEAGEAEVEVGSIVNEKEDTEYGAIYKKEVEVTYESETVTNNIPKKQKGTVYYNAGSKEIKKAEIELNDANGIERAGYIFVAWGIGDDEYNAGATISIEKNETLKAIWSENGVRIKFDYKTNGGASADVNSVTYVFGVSKPIDVSKIEAYKQGWTFIGWTQYEGAKTNPLTTYEPGANYGAGDTVTLYAMFEKEITVKYDLQDSLNLNIYGNLSETKTIYNNETTITATMPVVEPVNGNYKFVGWSKTATNTEAELEAGEVDTVSENTTYYAISYNKDAIRNRYVYYEDGSNEVKVKEVSCNKYNGSPTCETTSGLEGTTYKNGEIVGFSVSGTVIDEAKKQVVSENTTYYAIYERMLSIDYYSGENKGTHTTTFETVNYLANESELKEFGKDIILAVGDGLEGYTTLGWRKDEKAEEAEYGLSVQETIYKDETYYAVYKKDMQLKYTSKGEVEIPNAQNKVAYYNTAIASAKVDTEFTLAGKVTRTGYNFLGWAENSEDGTIYEAGSKINIKTNTTMYAVWEEKVYRVTYNGMENGGSSADQTRDVAYSHEIDLTLSANKTGYEFLGWNTDKDATEGLESITVPAENITLYAIYGKELTATFVMYDEAAGTLETNETTCIKYNKNETCSVETSDILANEGYTAVGWTLTTNGSTELDASLNFATNIEESKVYYSVTRKTDPLVGTFHYYGTDSIETQTSQCYLYNGVSTCEIEAPIDQISYEGISLESWSSNPTSYVESSFEINENKDFYANYEQTLLVNYHSGTYNGTTTDEETGDVTINSSSLTTETKTIEYIAGETTVTSLIPEITLATPVNLATYTTLGWRTTTDKAAQEYTVGQKINLTNSLELYASYSRDLKVTYVVDGGTPVPTNPQTTQYYNSGSGQTDFEVTLPTIKKSGYRFMGWAIDSINGTKYNAGDKIIVEKNTSVYATYLVSEFTVKFDSNGGTNVSTTKKVLYDEPYGELPTTSLTYNDFLGWYTEKTGGTKITADSIVKIEADSTFYAHWQTVEPPVLTGGNINYAPSRTISLSKAGTAASGIKHYEYYISTSATAPSNSAEPTGTTSGNYVFNENGLYYIWYRTVANSGIKSVWSANQYVRIDVDKPDADLRIETISGYKYLVFDTYDTGSGIDKLVDMNGNVITSSVTPVKIYIHTYTTADRTDNNNYAQLMKDMGYTDYKVASGDYPTAATLKAEGYNVFIDSQHVWGVNEIVNTYFSNGINVISIGNDSTSALTPITLNYLTTEPSVFSAKATNIFTKKLGILDNGTSQTDSRQRIKFVSGTQVLYKEVFDSDGSEYDGIGYYTANGTKWIHSQMALTNSLLPFLDASLGYMTNKGLYKYKLEYKGENKFKLYDNAGNVKDLVYDYSKTLPNLSVASSELYSSYTSYSPTNAITYDGNGALSVTSSDTSIAKVSLSGKTITITGGSTPGTATITVNAAETATYNSRQVTFTVNNRLDSSLSWGTPSVVEKTITLPFNYTGDGTLSVSVNDSSIGTATVDATTKKVTVKALGVGQLEVTLKISVGKTYYQSSITKTLTFGAAAQSNSTAFQTALTTWGKIGTASDANWFGSTTDSHIYAKDGSYVILESVNTNNYTGYYYKENGVTPMYEDITLDFDMTSTDGDDDIIGAMVRFRPESQANYFSGYVLLLDCGGYNSSVYNGLWRGNNKQFSSSGFVPWNTTSTPGGTKLVVNSSIKWARNKWQHYRFQAQGNKLTVWRWDTNTTGRYVSSDSAKIFEYTDISSSAIKSGSYGFWTYSQAYAQFKNFVAVTGNGKDFDISVN